MIGPPDPRIGTREERDFGAEFVFAHPVDNADRVHARETTIGTGGPICPFHFERTHSAPQGGTA
jgi:hypothetical protein